MNMHCFTKYFYLRRTFNQQPANRAASLKADYNYQSFWIFKIVE